MDITTAPPLAGRAQTQVDKVLDGYCKLRDKRRAELDYLRTVLEMAIEAPPQDRESLVQGALNYVKTL